MLHLFRFPQVVLCGGNAPLRRAVAPLVHAVLSLERVSSDANMDITFVSMQEMRSINYATRGKNVSTDVLTLNDSIDNTTFDKEDNGGVNLQSLLFASSIPSVSLITPRKQQHLREEELQRQELNKLQQIKSAEEETIYNSSSSNKEGNPTYIRTSRENVETQQSNISPISLFTSTPETRQQQRAYALELGSVYICLDDMYARCVRKPHHNLPFQMYVRAALVHGLLHALGYNHETPEQLREMIRKEQWIGSRLDVLSKRWCF